MERDILLCGRRVRYTLERKPVKNVNLRIKRDGSIWVSASRRVPVSFVEEFLRSRETFLCRHLQEAEEHPPLGKDQVCFRGMVYTVRAHTGQGKRPAAIEGKVLHLYLTGGEKLELAVRRWQKNQAEQVFAHALARMLPKIQPYYPAAPRVILWRMKARWGSCAVKNNTITLNLALVGAPDVCIDYVVLHELCHFVHPNHGSGFYALLEKLMPEYRECKKKLAAYAPLCIAGGTRDETCMD